MNKLTALRAIILYTIILFVTLRMFLGQRSRRYNKVDHYIYNLIKPFTAYEDNSKSANGPLELTSIDTFSRYLLFLGCLLSTVMTICYDTYLILFTLIFLVSEYPLSNDRMLPSPVNRIVTWITSHLINFQ